MIPWSVDQRPMPNGESVEMLAPKVVGAFQRTQLSSTSMPKDGSVYATYTSGSISVFMEIAATDEPSHAHAVVETAASETGDFPTDPRYGRLGTDPSYYFARDENGAFYAWTRGRYFFSAHAKSGDHDLDAFMRAFPF